MRKRRTHEDFKKEVYDLVGDEYTIESHFVNMQTKVKMKHKSCGYEGFVTPSNFIHNGTRCYNCNGKKKKSTREFKEEIFKIFNNNILILGEYISVSSKIEVMYTRCKHIREVTPASLTKSSGSCPICNKRTKKSSNQFKKEVFDKVGDEYSVLSEYKNNHTYVEMRHNKCNHRYKVTPKDFLHGYRCALCAGNKKKTTKEFQKEVLAKVGENYIVLSEYFNNKEKITMLHDVCGFVYKAIPTDVLRGHKCPKCSGNLKKSTSSFKNDVFAKVGNEYSVIGEYVNSQTKIKLKHNLCNHIFKMTPNSFLNSNQRCPKCAKELSALKRTITHQDFLLKFNKKTHGEFKLLSKYFDCKTKIKIKHCSDKCGGCEFETKPVVFLSKPTCPVCKESIGEKEVRLTLTQINIAFRTQYRIDNCRNTLPLPFDFAILDGNENIRCLIEYDGIQHFKPIKRFGGEEGFERCQQNDQIKNDYCKKNNIPLIRIPYWDFDNIKTILEKELSKLGIVSQLNTLDKK